VCAPLVAPPERRTSEEVVERQTASSKALSNLREASFAVAMSIVQVKKSLIVPEKFEAGATDLKLVDVVDRRQSAPFTAGVIEIKKSEPTEFDYDNDCAVIYCTEGSFILKEGGETTEVQAGDVVYIPQKKGLKVEWSTPNSGRGFYVTYPHWR